MVKKVLMSLTLVVIILVVVMAMSKPDSTAHYDEVKRFAMKVVDTEMNKKQIPEEYAMQATMEASDKVNSYLRSRMTVEDYAIASVALMKHQGSTYPIAIGAFGKVNILVGEDQVRQLFLKGWSSSGKYEEMLKKSEKQKQKYESQQK